MNRASARRRIARFGFGPVLLFLAAGIGIGNAQTGAPNQKGNAALFRQEIQNGHDPDLREFARQTLPKIEDHLQRALKLQRDLTGASSKGSASN